ncbi:MAG: hypothetical protein J0I84_21895 [Terrimonas sp.]|nr:hypothetical protein [Terrimonas sp.]OJY93594.1 MAG: hypothetical protein BGP13_04180 [Sphingobacteriales bacterium 40-81]
MTKIIIAFILITIVMILEFYFLNGSIIMGLNPFMSTLMFIAGGILIIYIALLISRIESKRSRAALTCFAIIGFTSICFFYRYHMLKPSRYIDLPVF